MGDNVCDTNSILRNFEPTKISYGKDLLLTTIQTTQLHSSTGVWSTTCLEVAWGHWAWWGGVRMGQYRVGSASMWRGDVNVLHI